MSKTNTNNINKQQPRLKQINFLTETNKGIKSTLKSKKQRNKKKQKKRAKSTEIQKLTDENTNGNTNIETEEVLFNSSKKASIKQKHSKNRNIKVKTLREGTEILTNLNDNDATINFRGFEMFLWTARNLSVFEMLDKSISSPK